MLFVEKLWTFEDFFNCTSVDNEHGYLLLMIVGFSILSVTMSRLFNSDHRSYLFAFKCELNFISTCGVILLCLSLLCYLFKELKDFRYRERKGLIE